MVYVMVAKMQAIEERITGRVLNSGTVQRWLGVKQGRSRRQREKFTDSGTV
jgi:hypothetical protein